MWRPGKNAKRFMEGREERKERREDRREEKGKQNKVEDGGLLGLGIINGEILNRKKQK